MSITRNASGNEYPNATAHTTTTPQCLVIINTTITNNTNNHAYGNANHDRHNVPNSSGA